MKFATTLLIAIVLIELVVAGLYFRHQTQTTVPLLPHERLADPSIMPQLEELANAAQDGSADDWSRLGEGLLGKGFYAHAELAFREALHQDPERFDALFGVAFCLDRTGRIQESSVAYGRVVQGAAESPEQQAMQVYALYAMGRNALRLEDEQQANRLFQQNADYPAAEYQQAKLLLRSGEAQKALPLIRKNLAKIPYSLGFHFLDQRAQQELGNERAAYMAQSMVERSAYLVSLNFSTNYVAPLNDQTGIDTQVANLAEALEEKDWAKAEAICREVNATIDDAPVFVAKPVRDAMLQIGLHDQRPQEVLTLVEDLESEGRVDAITLEAAGDAHLLLKNLEPAIECWQRALKLRPSVSLHQKLADHLPDQENFHHSKIAFLRGLEHYRRNRLRSAIPEFERAIELDSNSTMAWYYLGEMYFHLDQSEKASEAYEQCLRVAPEFQRAADKLAYLNGE